MRSVQVWEGVALADRGDECSVNWGDGEGILSKLSPNRLFRSLSNLFLNFITLVKKADPRLRRWLAPCSTL